MKSEIIKHLKFIEIKLTGNYTYEDIDSGIEAIPKFSMEESFSLILINIIAVNFEKMDYMERFFHSEKTAKIFRSTGIRRTALVADKKYINKFGENVARNRGLNFLVFHDRKDAEEWLLE